VSPAPNPTFGIDDTLDVDQVTLNFAPEPDGVLIGALVQFTIESTFTGGVTITAFGADTFNNETRFEPFQLLSGLVPGRCNY
jgi:hypothetical protein